jgi:hypothetical protein
MLLILPYHQCPLHGNKHPHASSSSEQLQRGGNVTLPDPCVPFAVHKGVLSSSTDAQ